MSEKTDEILKKYESLHEDPDQHQKDHSLREQAQERTKDPLHINAGTAFDWEDMEAYKRELERLDREGPGIKKK